MINYFSSIFEIMTALNFAYAGSKNFRGILNNDILKIAKKMSHKWHDKIPKLAYISKKVLSVKQQEELNCEIESKRRYLVTTFKKIEEKEELARKFGNGMKSIFLIAAFYSLAALILGGLEKSFYEDSNNFKIFLKFFNLSGIVIVMFFIRNCFPKYDQSNIKPLVSLMFFLTPIFVLYPLYLYFSPLTGFTIDPMRSGFYLICMVAISMSAFILHIFRALAHRRLFKFKYQWVYKKANKQIKVYEKSLTKIDNLK